MMYKFFYFKITNKLNNSIFYSSNYFTTQEEALKSKQQTFKSPLYDVIPIEDLGLTGNQK
jgi:hypothetical protein